MQGCARLWKAVCILLLLCSYIMGIRKSLKGPLKGVHPICWVHKCSQYTISPKNDFWTSKLVLALQSWRCFSKLLETSCDTSCDFASASLLYRFSNLLPWAPYPGSRPRGSNEIRVWRQGTNKARLSPKTKVPCQPCHCENLWWFKYI